MNAKNICGLDFKKIIPALKTTLKLILDLYMIKPPMRNEKKKK